MTGNAERIKWYENLLVGAKTTPCCYHLVDTNGLAVFHELMSESVVLDSESDCRYCLGTGHLLVEDD